MLAVEKEAHLQNSSTAVFNNEHTCDWPCIKYINPKNARHFKLPFCNQHLLEGYVREIIDADDTIQSLRTPKNTVDILVLSRMLKNA